MLFPDSHNANFLMACDGGSAVVYVYEPPPRYAPSFPRASHPEAAFVVAQESPRASVEHGWKCFVGSNAYGESPFSQLCSRSVSPCDGLLQTGILRIALDAPVQRARAIRSHAGSSRNADIDS